MNVLVFGATGRVGRHTVQALIDRRHAVTAFGHSVETTGVDLVGRSPCQGDVLHYDDVERVMPGHDIVVLTFGTTLDPQDVHRQPNLSEDGTRNVVSAMTAHGIPRLVCMTASGSGTPDVDDHVRSCNIVDPATLRRILKHRAVQAEIVETSDLPEWVIVRTAKLVDGVGGAVRVVDKSDDGPTRRTITRGDVGRFLARLATDTCWDGLTITIAN